MAVNWQELDDAYYDLLGARQRGDVEVMGQLGRFERAVTAAVDTHAADLADQGQPWSVIGAAYGTTRQAASKRWRNRA